MKRRSASGVTGHKGSEKFTLQQGLPFFPQTHDSKEMVATSEECISSVTLQDVIIIMAPRVGPNSSNVFSSWEDMKFLDFHSFAWTGSSSPGVCCLILLLSDSSTV